jgi:hypothetical protein
MELPPPRVISLSPTARYTPATMPPKPRLVVPYKYKNELFNKGKLENSAIKAA